jgi:hypothetical protein
MKKKYRLEREIVTYDMSKVSFFSSIEMVSLFSFIKNLKLTPIQNNTIIRLVTNKIKRRKKKRVETGLTCFIVVSKEKN